MPRFLGVLLAVPLIAVACSAPKLDADGLEEHLETRGFRNESLSDVRCRPGAEGWDYICTFRLGREIGREKAAFVVDWDGVETSTSAMALDLPVGPAPGSPDRESFTAFVGAASTICGTRRRGIAALPPAGGRAGFVGRLARAAEIQRVELADLEALTPPPGSGYARRVAELLGEERELLAASARFRAAARRGKAEAALKAAGDVEVSARRLDKLARSLGLTRCVQTR